MNELNVDDLQLAPMKARVKAFVIDDILITVLIIFVFWEVFNNSVSPEELILQMNSLVYQVIFIKFLYHTFFVWYYGATLGKIFAKIKVIDNNTLNKVSLLNAAFRSSARVISEMFFYIGFFVGFFNDGKRTFHDILGRTIVVSA